MDSNKSLSLINGIISEIQYSNGVAAVNDFSSLRAVDSKVSETKIILKNVDSIPQDFINEMENDDGFNENSRRVRLETLARYCKTARKFIETEAFKSKRPTIKRAPDISQLTSDSSGL